MSRLAMVRPVMMMRSAILHPTIRPQVNVTIPSRKPQPIQVFHRHLSSGEGGQRAANAKKSRLGGSGKAVIGIVGCVAVATGVGVGVVQLRHSEIPAVLEKKKKTLQPGTVEWQGKAVPPYTLQDVSALLQADATSWTPSQGVIPSRENARLVGVQRCDGISVKSNEPCEDQMVLGVQDVEGSGKEWLFWGVFDGHKYDFFSFFFLLSSKLNGNILISVTIVVQQCPSPSKNHSFPMSSVTSLNSIVRSRTRHLHLQP